MRCIKPVRVKIKFNENVHYVDVPCGKCIACRVNRSQELEGRIQREYEQQVAAGRIGWFVTFTYSDENLPADNSLSRKVVTLLAHRLRNRCKIPKYFFCGEYGSEYGRAHYHAIIFTEISDFWKMYDICVASWQNGFVYLKRMHFRSAKYISKYVVKADDRYYKGRQPCFVQMSQRFGLADYVEQSYEVRKLAKTSSPYVYRDVLGKKHPYPRRAISAAFSPEEKEYNMFKKSSEYDEFMHKLWERSGSTLDYDHWIVEYDNLRADTLEETFWKRQYYKIK